jgi:(R,R)-butanediol dehydrogenase / meso-butanediol dehydrogenase / diacetyl reductase
MSTSMKALQWHGPRDIRLVRIAVPSPGPDDVLIEVVYCGICGSDLHEYEDGPHAIPVGMPHVLSGRSAPLTLGHEFCGTVMEKGANVLGLRVGDRVGVEPEYRCSRCRYCQIGDYNLCDSMGFAGLMGDGGMAEYVVTPAYMVHRLPDGVPFVQAAVLEPAAVALHALRRSSLRIGGTCAVFGLGPIGILLVMLARLQGASSIVAVDVSPERLAAATHLGATEVIDARGMRCDEVASVVRGMTGGGVDVSFEAAGLQTTFEGAMYSLRKGGEAVMVGLMQRAGFDAFRAVNDELSIRASVGYRHVYPDLIRLVEARAIDLSAIVTKTVSLERAVVDGFDVLLRDKTQIKVLVAPGGIASGAG